MEHQKTYTFFMLFALIPIIILFTKTEYAHYYVRLFVCVKNMFVNAQGIPSKIYRMPDIGCTTPTIKRQIQKAFSMCCLLCFHLDKLYLLVLASVEHPVYIHRTLTASSSCLMIIKSAVMMAWWYNSLVVRMCVFFFRNFFFGREYF